MTNLHNRAGYLALAWILAAAGPLTPASAATIIELSQTHDFSGLVVNRSGQTAYFATPLNEPDDAEFDLDEIHRDGGLFVAPGGAFKEIGGPLLITDTGIVAFSGFQGEFQLPDAQGVDEGTLEEVGGVYRGGNPTLPVDNQARVITGDSLWSSGNSTGATALAHADNGDILLTGAPTTPRVRFPFPKGCPGNRVDSEDVFWALPPFDRMMDINGSFAAGFVNDFTGTFLTLTTYPTCGPDYDDEALRQATLNVFSSVSTLKLGAGEIYVTAFRNTANGLVRGIYSVTFDGAVTTIIESGPDNNITPQGVTQSGEYFYLDRLPSGQSAWFFSASDEPLLAAGHQIGDFIWRGCGSAAFSDTGILACTGELQRIDDPSVEFNAVIIADGSSDFPPDPEEPEPEVLFWNNETAASFFDPDSWDPQAVPSSDQIAVFASIGGSDVQFGSQSANSQQLRIERGFFQFFGGSYQLNTGSAATPSLLLQPGSPGDIATLTIAAGHQLQTRYATIDSNGSAGGLLNAIFLDGDRNITQPQNRWDNEGRLVVNGNLGIGWSGGLVTDSTRIGSAFGDSGEVSIDSGTGGCPLAFSANLGTTWVGYGGDGRLAIGPGCIVDVAGERIVGAQQGSLGIVDIDQGVWSPLTPGASDNMIVGQAGTGEVTVRDSTLDAGDLTLGLTISGVGELTVERSTDPFSLVEASNELVVGNAGIARLTVLEGGWIQSPTLEIGRADTAFGELRASGAPPTGFSDYNVDIAGDATVSLAGNGELSLENGAQMRSADGYVGVAGSGSVVISDSAAWALDGELSVGLATNGSNPGTCDGDEETIGTGTIELRGSGPTVNLAGQTLSVSGPNSMLSGAGQTAFANHIIVDCAQLSPGNSPGILTLDGNLQFTGAILLIEVDGTESGQYDVLRVTGDANLSGGIVRFVFNDFLPQQGNQLTFVEAGGSLALADMQYDYEGAIPGFEFSVSDDGNGNLLFTADNNAQGDNVFVNGFE